MANFRLAITEREAQGLESQSRWGVREKNKPRDARMLLNHMHGNIGVIMIRVIIILIICNAKLTL